MPDDKITLIPIAMRRATEDFTQAPSRLRSPIELSESEFSEIADTAKSSSVSFDADGISNPQLVTSYRVPMKVKGGLKGWRQRCIVK